ncbi:MAG: hypothetical protein U0172_09450 [Nitrospiraceae bacterium]
MTQWTGSPGPSDHIGWAFFMVRALLVGVRIGTRFVHRRLVTLASSALLCAILLIATFTSIGALSVSAADHPTDHSQSAEGASRHSIQTNGWEGSVGGIAYSQGNHRIAGLLVLALGLSELLRSNRRVSRAVTLVLPASLMAMGVLLTIWSDHDAWPIGTGSFGESYFGEDREVVQHKWIGIASFLVGTVEGARRLSVWQSGWSAYVLPLYSLGGGLLLFMHQHGKHPAAEVIAGHHEAMGLLAIIGGLAKVVAETGLSRGTQANASSHDRGAAWGDLVWGVAVILVGLLLLVYRER